MKVERESFVRFAVAVALACYDLPADRAMTSDEAARLVKGVIDMALGPAASGVLVEPMRNYPPSGKMPLIISVAGVQQHLFWFYPQQPFRRCVKRSQRCSMRSPSPVTVSRRDRRNCV